MNKMSNVWATPKAIKVRACMECGNPMELVKCRPAFVSASAKTYTCNVCDNTEIVTTLSKSWLNVVAAS